MFTKKRCIFWKLYFFSGKILVPYNIKNTNWLFLSQLAQIKMTNRSKSEENIFNREIIFNRK